MELKDQLSALQAELKTFVNKADAERKQNGTMQTETKSTIEKLQSQVDAIDVKLAAKQASTEAAKPLAESLKESDEVSRIVRNKKGHATFEVKSRDLEQKTVVTSTGFDVAVQGFQPGIIGYANQALTLRSLLTASPTTLQIIEYIRATGAVSPAQPAPETTTKFEQAQTFAAASERVRTIATVLPATKQILDDFTDLAAFINTTLAYSVRLGEELQMISGDGTGENLHGFIAQAQAFDTSVLGNTDNKIDVVGHAMAQIALAKELAPSFVVLNSGDWWKIRLTKDNYGRYILGDPQSSVSPSLFGVDVVPTTNMAAGSFLVGSASPVAAEIRDRQGVTIEISTEDGNNFRTNMVTIRAEERLALLVKRPNAYVTGSFGTH